MEKFITYWRNMAACDRAALAEHAGTTVGYISKAISVGQRFGPELCVSIERATAGVITRRDLRPDDWIRIWPELQGAA